MLHVLSHYIPPYCTISHCIAYQIKNHTASPTSSASMATRGAPPSVPSNASFLSVGLLSSPSNELYRVKKEWWSEGKRVKCKVTEIKKWGNRGEKIIRKNSAYWYFVSRQKWGTEVMDIRWKKSKVNNAQTTVSQYSIKRTDTEKRIVTLSALMRAGGSSTQNLLVSSASTAATAAPLLCLLPIERATSNLAPNSCEKKVGDERELSWFEG